MAAVAHPLVANLYNPHEQSREQLIEGFVVRHKILKQLFREIKSSTMQFPEQHYLIEGQRGMGKTTLLLRLSYQIENDEELNTWLIPIVLKEEAYYGIHRLFQLWEEVAQELEAKDTIFSGLLEQMRAGENDEDNYEQHCFQVLVDALDTQAKKIILFIDNLGEMFQNFDDEESHRLREILMTCSHLRIIGATSIVLEASFKYEHAFYEFFKKKQLEGLSREETRDLLLQLAKTYNDEGTIQNILNSHPGRVEALRLLTGGVIRTIILLFEIFVDDKDGDSLSDLDQILDRVTPLYKHRMDDLTKEQRPVVNAIALNWDAISPQEIAKRAHLKIDQVTTLLSELEKVFIVQRAPTGVGQDLYYLQERFFNIWYLMRLSPRGSQARVVWLVRFLENWYDQEELIARAKRHTKALRKGNYAPKAAYYLTEALARTGKLSADVEHEMKLETKELLDRKDQLLAAHLSPSDKDLFLRALACVLEGNYENALTLLSQVKNKNGDVFLWMAFIYMNLEEYTKSEQHYLQAIDAGDADALNNLAWLYFTRRSNKQRAIEYARQAVGKKKDKISLHTLACIYIWNNKTEEAVETAKEFINDQQFLDENEEDVTLFLMLLLAKKQHQTVRQYFETSKLDLKERLKPIYYALLHLTGDKDYARLPPEISETVQDILKKIAQLTIDYR